MFAKRKTLLRMINIQRVLVRHGLDDIITATHFMRPMRFIFKLFPRARDVSEPLGKRIRLALIELGPIFVKFGQAISTRRDLLPPDIADELAMLQDRVPPFPADEAVAILDKRLWTKQQGFANIKQKTYPPVNGTDTVQVLLANQR